MAARLLVRTDFQIGSDQDALGCARFERTVRAIAPGPPSFDVSACHLIEPNAKNPSGFQETKRVDVTSKSHTNPDGKVVPTPHVKEPGTPGVRPANPDELPSR